MTTRRAPRREGFFRRWARLYFEDRALRRERERALIEAQRVARRRGRR